jgi:hypothetical protein
MPCIELKIVLIYVIHEGVLNDIIFNVGILHFIILLTLGTLLIKQLSVIIFRVYLDLIYLIALDLI